MALDHPNTIQRTEIIRFNALKRRPHRPRVARPSAAPRVRIPRADPPAAVFQLLLRLRVPRSLLLRRSSRPGLPLRLRPPGAPQQPRRPPRRAGLPLRPGLPRDLDLARRMARREGSARPAPPPRPAPAAGSGRRRRDARGQRAPAADATSPPAAPSVVRAGRGLLRPPRRALTPRAAAGPHLHARGSNTRGLRPRRAGCRRYLARPRGVAAEPRAPPLHIHIHMQFFSFLARFLKSKRLGSFLLV